MHLYNLILLFFVTSAVSDEDNHIYEPKDDVLSWINTVGTFRNRKEIYNYFTLPFCLGSRQTISKYHKSLSEALQGFDVLYSGLDMQFQVDVPKVEFCQVQMNEQKQGKFVHAVKNHYWYRMYIDDIPIWGKVGEVSNSSYYIWTHKKFEIGYNEKRIVEASITSEDRVLLTPDTMLRFTYEVIWQNSSLTFENRFDKNSNPDYFQTWMQCFIIINSLMMVILVIGLVSMVLMRMWRKDVRYGKDGVIDDMVTTADGCDDLIAKDDVESTLKH